jgi:type II secretory pathway component PulF
MMNKKGQLGGLFRYWKILLFGISSMFGVLIIYKFVFQTAFNSYILPVFITMVKNSPIDPATQAIILQNYNNLPIYIGICVFAVMMIILIYLTMIAFREEQENARY